MLGTMTLSRVMVMAASWATKEHCQYWWDCRLQPSFALWPLTCVKDSISFHTLCQWVGFTYYNCLLHVPATLASDQQAVVLVISLCKPSTLKIKGLGLTRSRKPLGGFRHGQEQFLRMFIRSLWLHWGRWAGEKTQASRKKYKTLQMLVDTEKL